MTLLSRLFAPLHDFHRSIEATPLARTIVAGAVSLGSYGNLMSQHWYLRRDLEYRILPFANLFQPLEMSSLQNSQLLEMDIRILGIEISPPRPETISLLSLFAKWNEEAPSNLIVPLLLLEGARMGSLLYARSVASTFGLSLSSGSGLDYHTQNLASRIEDWNEIKLQADKMVFSEEEISKMCNSCKLCLDSFLTLYKNLNPLA